MSYEGRTRISETSRLSTTSVVAPFGSWSAKIGRAFTCRSGFSGSMTIVRQFPNLLRRLGLLTQRMWLWPFKILWSMSLPRQRGVSKRRRCHCGSLRRCTLNGSTMYRILCSASMRPLLSKQLMSLLPRRLLLSRPNKFLTHFKAIVDSAMSHPNVFTSPLFVDIMEGIRSEYNIIQEEPVSRRRTRSHSPQE